LILRLNGDYARDISVGWRPVLFLNSSCSSRAQSFMASHPAGLMAMFLFCPDVFVSLKWDSLMLATLHLLALSHHSLSEGLVSPVWYIGVAPRQHSHSCFWVPRNSRLLLSWTNVRRCASVYVAVVFLENGALRE
jgi:hypothetical protein